MRALLEEWLCSAGYRVPETAPGMEHPNRADLAIVSMSSPKHAGSLGPYL